MDIRNSDCMTVGPWYTTSICNKLHGNIFEGLIINARTDIYHVMCSIDKHFSKAMADQISRLKNPHTSLHTYAKTVPEATRKEIYTAVNGQ